MKKMNRHLDQQIFKQVYRNLLEQKNLTNLEREQSDCQWKEEARKFFHHLDQM